MDENFEKYCQEYLDLINAPGIPSKAAKHRKKILKEWIDNELAKQE